jgi:ATP-binding protein involved in chromosome partitioning
MENMERPLLPPLRRGHQRFSTGGGKRAAEGLGVLFRGAVSIDPEMRALGDKGIPFEERETRASGSFEEDEVAPGK